MKAIKNLITKSETTKATKQPISNNKRSDDAMAGAVIRYLIPFNSDAPIMTGIDKKKENSAATSRLHNNNIAPKIVTPLLEVPGINDNN